MISVIMSTYREKVDVLKKAIDSILNQTYRDFELVICLDDPNNEEHQQILSEYAKQDPRIRFFRNETNLGLTKTLNKELSLAKGEYIARMDADDISFPDRLERQLEHLVKNGYDLIGGITIMVDENEQLVRKIQSIPTDEKKIKKCLQYSQCIAHPTWFGKREVFNALDGYRNVPYCEDYDFTLRAALQGYRISNLNEPVLYYRLTSQGVSRQNSYRQYLYMRYITDCYRKGEVADLDQMEQAVNEQFDQKKADSFVRSNIHFHSMLKDKTDKHYASFVKHGLALVLGSREFLDKILRFAYLTLNS